MLSAIPATLFSSADSMLGNPFPSFENSFTPPWDCSELFSFDDPQSPKPVVSSSGSDDPNEPNRSPQNQTNSNCSSDPKPNTVSMIDERKRRRMISNRESARRSRMRKQRHLENLRNQVNRLRVENRELMNRLRFFVYHCQNVQRENELLRSEHSILRQKLSNIRQIFMFRQLQELTSARPCNNTNTTQ